MIAGLLGGGFVAVWQTADNGSDTDIRARLFDANGTAVSINGSASDFLVSTLNTGEQTAVRLASLPGGGFVFVWQSSENGPDSEIRARLFAASGIAAGADFAVSTVDGGGQTNPAIAVLADGRFAITWEATNGGASGTDIRGRVFNADGTPDNGFAAGILFNTSLTNAQLTPQIAALSGGGFATVWTSADQPTADDIRARVFAPSTALVYNEITGSDNPATPDNLSGTADNDKITLLAGDDIAFGLDGNDWLSGGAGIDRLFGGIGNDIIDGGARDDYMIGGAGDDTYYVDIASDIVYEAIDGGFDTIFSSISYAMVAGQEIETLTATNSGGATLSGNEFANTLNGTAAQDNLYGGAGNDSLFGLAGNDYLSGDDGDDTLESGEGDDQLSGGAGNDRLTGDIGSDKLLGGSGNDWLDGGTDGDYLIGGSGIDTYVVDNTGDVIVDNLLDSSIVIANSNYALAGGINVTTMIAGSAGTDYVLSGNELANAITGSGGIDILHGGGGADSLTGGAGSDALLGGAGNDTFIFNTADFAYGVNDQIFGFNDASGDFDRLNLQGGAAGYSFTDAGSDVIVVHLATGSSIQIFGFTAARLSDQITYF